MRSGRRARFGMVMPRFRTLWWNRLSVKLAAVLAVITTISVGLLVWLVVGLQERYLLDEVVRGAARFSDTIKASTYHNMLDDRRDAAYQSMETVGALEGIEWVRMMNKEGRLTFSTDPAEAGRSVDKRAEACYACHAAGQPLIRLNLPSRSRIYSTNGHRVLAMVTPIYNEPACYNAGCHSHPTGQQVLGVVDLAISLKEIDAELADLRRSTVLFGLLSGGILAVVAVVFMKRSVVSPVAAMLEGTRRVARLDLEQRIPVHRSDELGQLAASFNAMTSSLSQSRQALSDANANLERQVEERTEALRQTQAQLVQSEKLSSLGRLAASVAHEINNPLAGILTYAKLLIRMIDENDPVEKLRAAGAKQLRLIQRETERCSAIVRNLLDFARQRPLTLKDVDLNAAIEDALQLLSNQMAIHGITLERRLGQVPAVHADIGQLRQALVNIVMNGCEAMTRGGTLTVTSRPSTSGREVEVAVADTGVGIPPDHLSKIVDPFFTTKEKGTGLGLSVVYGIVERHGGRLDISSVVGQGTVVTIRLPASAGTGNRA